MPNDTKRLTFSEFVEELYLKMGPTCGDVHVDVPLTTIGTKPKKPKPHAAGPDKGSDPVAKNKCVACGGDWPAIGVCKCGEVAKSYEIIKSSDEQRMVYGWASVISEGGVAVVDTQGDVIEADELEKSWTEFMKDARHLALMHERNADGSFTADLSRGSIVHSFPLTKALMDGLGIQCDREGTIVGVYVAEDEAWEGVKSGKYRAFSIGGSGNRVPVD